MITYTLRRSEPKYPKIEVQLTGEDGNAWSVLGRMRKALRRAKIGNDEIEQFTKEATNGDYNHLLATCMEWVTVN